MRKKTIQLYFTYFMVNLQIILYTFLDIKNNLSVGEQRRGNKNCISAHCFKHDNNINVIYCKYKNTL